jgi:secreted glycosyl hydrolase
MDLWDAASLNGRRVQLWDCVRTNGADGQSEPIEAQRVIFDQGKLSIEGKCLDVYQQRNANGTPVHLWDCVPAPTQQWKHLPDGQFQNVQTGKCLAVREDSSENGTVLHIWDCHPGQTEKWSFGR